VTGLIPRVRMFAGPNGSGKSTLFRKILPPSLQGIYLNPDEIEEDVRRQDFLDLGAYGVKSGGETIVGFFQNSAFLRREGLGDAAGRLRYSPGRLHFEPGTANAYFASVASDFIRHALLEAKVSFTFETVMSSPDKVEFLARAQAAGCRTYLYYVATEDPIINESRVQGRVANGGHPVPMEKIASRYHRSLALLPAAIRASNRAYIFDNSGIKGEHTWLAEITDGQTLELKTDQVPAWFNRSVLDVLGGE
jgi:predicted ABC-type ATPase